MIVDDIERVNSMAQPQYRVRVTRIASRTIVYEKTLSNPGKTLDELRSKRYSGRGYRFVVDVP